MKYFYFIVYWWSRMTSLPNW